MFRIRFKHVIAIVMACVAIFLAIPDNAHVTAITQRRRQFGGPRKLSAKLNDNSKLAESDVSAKFNKRGTASDSPNSSGRRHQLEWTQAFPGPIFPTPIAVLRELEEAERSRRELEEAERSRW
ncbi:hypothetical protein HK102_000768 [Quaeritorhiza haematococci]|nr:hypothetical protein HK102_000768 [Quaeritorhiza haematococci]